MANYCDYEVKVIGSKKAGLMVYESMPCMDFKRFEWEKGLEDSTTIYFTGNCKWSVNFGVTDNLNYVNVDAMSESEIESKGIDYWDYSLRAKSEAFQCEIMVHYWSEESGFDQFDHYKNGKILKQRKIEYNYDEQNEFDWDKLEFIGHEGEYDENVDGEQQNEDLMAILMALGGTMPSDECEEHEDNQEELSATTANLVDLLDQIEELAAEAGIDLDDGSIGDTGFDMYNWTFSQGNTAKGNGWTIAIPDGFVQISSRGDELITGKKRIFELVPVTYQYENDIDKVPIRILPGDMQDIQNLEMVHPNARAGIAGAIGVTNAEVMSQLLGTAPELLAVGWEDAAAHIMVQDTSGGTYSYQCSVIAKGKLQQLRVQTQFVTDKQKQSLSVSVKEWLKTMKFNKNNKADAKTKFEERDCLDELLIGKTEMLEEAVKQAHTEYLAAINGRMKMLEFMGQYGMLNEHTGETIREILESGMAVKLFFLEKADEFVNKLQNNNVNAVLLEDVIKKLADLDEDLLGYNYGDEVIEITVPEKVQAIRDKWEKIASDAFCAQSKEDQARLKGIEEKRRQELEMEKMHYYNTPRGKEYQKMKSYDAKVEQWEAEVKLNNEQRKEFIDDKFLEKEMQLNAELTAVKAEKDAKEKELNQTVTNLRTEKASVEQNLAALGVFAFGEKKSLKREINELEEKITAAVSQATRIKEEYEEKLEEIKESIKKAKEALQKEAEKKYPAPSKPKADFDRDAAYEFLIMEFLKDDFHMLSEVKDGIPEFKNVDMTEISRIVSGLVKRFEVVRIEERRKAYFRVS